MRKRILLNMVAIFLAIVVVVGALIFTLEQAESAFVGLNGKVLIGGRVNDIFICCNGVMYTVGPPRGGRFLGTSSTRWYMWYQMFREHVWFLGLADPGGMCRFGSRCRSATPVDGVINIVGTSLY